ncbi:MAG TPA: hypothetical protein VE077_10960 [Candidatus Methylomirabilis sp.]|nr:hypothetical protein [Candidatus Methylomirabilis sp.]
MSSTTRHLRSFFTPPRDYVHRRRYRRRLVNFIGVPLLSIMAAYVITRPTGGTGFRLPKSAQGATSQGRLGSPAGAATTAVSSDPLRAPAVASARVFANAYKLDDGPDAVTEVQEVALHDAKRNKTLHVRVFYPAGAGPFPVIVFSHGAGGSQFCCDGLTRHWASYGYVTLQPTHEDSTSQRRTSGEDVNFLKAVREALKKPELWESRPEDISFLLDSLGVLQEEIPALAGKLDAHRIGVGGHSMGAFTADAIAGALVDLPGRPGVSFADARVKAALLLSPQGPGEFGLNDHSWDRVSLPLMSMTGSLDTGANGAGPDWRKIPFDRSEAGDKYHVFIEGANHMSFILPKALLPGRAAHGEVIFNYTNCAALAFWDAYLKGDSSAKQYLQSDALTEYSHGAVKLSRR